MKQRVHEAMMTGQFMSWSPDAETQNLIWHLSLQNAFEYDGKGAAGSVIGRIMSTRADLRQHGGQISPLVAQSVAKANSLAKKKGQNISKLFFSKKHLIFLKVVKSRKEEKVYLL